MTYEQALINECIHKLDISLLKTDKANLCKKLLKIDDRFEEEDLQEIAKELIGFARARGYTRDDVARHCQVMEATVRMACNNELDNDALLLLIITQLNSNYLNKFIYEDES